MSKELSRNRLARYGLLLLALVLVGGMLLAWDDARGKEQDTLKHPTGSDEVIVRIELSGGFMMPLSHATRIPSFTLYGDGCYIIEGPVIAIYPGPALPNLQQGCLTDEGVQQVLRAAQDAGLLDGDVNDTIDIIADAATTVFTVSAHGKTFVTTVYAFEEADPSVLTAEQIARRAKLKAFQQSLPVNGNVVADDLVAQPEQAFNFERLTVIVIDGAPFASDGIEQGEVAWPLAQDLAGFGDEFSAVPDARCGVVEGADLDLLKTTLQGANSESIWTSEGAEFTVVALPLLPDQTGCSAPAM
ncbi:MAG TPA: hypothetical protein VMM78_04065 [Thermomicrobiales bacterium]|nr:hypothetical protein [Thermomicrobiales bacterium]